MLYVNSEKENFTADRKHFDNRGISLVEVIVAVAILAAVSAPILKSFVTAAKTNARAQITQNVTSLAEDVMEKIKSTDIETLHNEALVSGTVIGNTSITAGDIIFLSSGNTTEDSDFDNSKTPPFSITYKNVTATSGKVYDAIVDIDVEKYKKASSDDASDANTFAVPEIKDIDSTKHAVLSWEMNSIDESAIDRIVDENNNDSTTRSTIKDDAKLNGIKTTTITIDEESYVDSADSSNNKELIKVSCMVKYDPKTSGMKPVEHLVYTGYFEKPTDINDGPNLYLFFSTMRIAGVGGSYSYFKNEKIEVYDKTNSQKHDIYLILQGGVKKLQDNSNPSEVINIGMDVFETASNVKTSVPVNPQDNIFSLSGSGAKLYTNLQVGGSTGDDESDMFEKKQKNRIYYVTVKITKPSAEDISDGSEDVYTIFTSTMNTGDEAKN